MKNKEGFTAFNAKLVEYEEASSKNRFIKKLPIIVKIKLNCIGGKYKEFIGNESFDNAMIETSKELVKITKAKCAHVYMDRITLLLYDVDGERDLYYGGYVSRIISSMSSHATRLFNKFYHDADEKDFISLCDAYNVPDLEEVINVFLLDEIKVNKKSVYFLYTKHLSPTNFFTMSNKIAKEELLENGICWYDCTHHYKRGTYIMRRETTKKMIEECILNGEHYKKHDIGAFELPPLVKIKNKVSVLVFGEDEILEDINK